MADTKKKVVKKNVKEVEVDKALPKCSVCECTVCECKPEVSLFTKLGKDTEGMAIVGLGVLVRNKEDLVFIPGAKIIELKPGKHLLTKM